MHPVPSENPSQERCSLRAGQASDSELPWQGLGTYQENGKARAEPSPLPVSTNGSYLVGSPPCCLRSEVGNLDMFYWIFKAILGPYCGSYDRRLRATGQHNNRVSVARSRIRPN
jgi:hypothetical protein